ncbi:fructosamine kinase family protein [Labilibacter sediminis]|nr:fructosamine kinase family protein [Labilibacter sediminis]
MNRANLEILSEKVGEKLHFKTGVGGGCIADSSIVESESGKKYFLKQGCAEGMFSCEANGLREIQKSNTIKTPHVITEGGDYLLMELIDQGRKTPEAMYNFGKAFGQMHRTTHVMFGFYEDNYIGATPQENTKLDTWLDFYFIHRLLFQYKLIEKNGYLTSELKSKFKHIESKLPAILSGSEEEPALLHGDLWAGNYLIDSKGQAVLIDPAVYFGHREADLAMTKLFGGFSPEFYEGYNDFSALPEGCLYRENIYLLYHVFNHLNLFGTGYYSQAVSLMNSYL